MIAEVRRAVYSIGEFVALAARPPAPASRIRTATRRESTPHTSREEATRSRSAIAPPSPFHFAPSAMSHPESSGMLNDAGGGPLGEGQQQQQATAEGDTVVSNAMVRRLHAPLPARQAAAPAPAPARHRRPTRTTRAPPGSTTCAAGATSTSATPGAATTRSPTRTSPRRRCRRLQLPAPAPPSSATPCASTGARCSRAERARQEPRPAAAAGRRATHAAAETAGAAPAVAAR
jgi:hypothetical protein